MESFMCTRWSSLALLLLLLAQVSLTSAADAAQRNSEAEDKVVEILESLSLDNNSSITGNYSNGELLGQQNGTTASEDPSIKGYRSNAQLLKAMEDLSTRCRNISRLYSIGKSVNGVPLTVLEISDKPGEPEPEPAFKYVGNMHGDEPSGRELSLHLAEWLCSNYLVDPLATLIVQNVHLHLLPSMNPDGFESVNRNNANDVDLNRDFPDQFFPDINNERSGQPETRAVMGWIRNNRFTASASLHEGALVASYGWDGTASGRTGYAKAPDDGAFAYMAALYAEHNPSMKKSIEFKGGVTNGAAWYPLYGGMQDWNYIHGNCFEITLEMSDAKWPDATKIPALWKQHKQSMLMLIASLVKSGVHGRVMSSKDGMPLQALISVAGNSHDINASSKFGDYHRILPPGKTYEVTASLSGYLSRTKTVLLPEDKASTLDFLLDPVPAIEKTLEDFPLLRGTTRNRKSEKSTTEELVGTNTVVNNLENPDQTSRSKLLYPETRVFEEADIVSGMLVDHLRFVSFGATLAVMACVLYLLFTWRGGLRGQTNRHLPRRT